MRPHILYARKSTESDDRQVLSIESQIQELRHLAARQGITIDEVLTEAHSAKAPGRPIFSALMKRVARNEVAGILAWKMDRLARNHFDTGLVLQALADGQLDRVITIDRTYTNNGNDRFIGTFELGMATKYIDDLRQNVKRGLKMRLERGWRSGIPPLGFQNDFANHTIVKDPDRFPLIRRLWDLMLSGTMTPRQILRIANEELQLRTRAFKRQGGKQLSHSLIYKILTNPFYMGILRMRDGRVYKGSHEPMVTVEEFEKVQSLLGRPGKQRPKRHEFPFTGLLKCASCSGAVTAEVHRKPSGLEYVYYHCSRQRKDSTCPYAAISGHDLETQIRQHLSRLTLPTRVVSWARRVAAQTFAKEREQHEKLLGLTRTAERQLATESETLLALRLQNQVSDAEFTSHRQRIEERKIALDIKLRSAERSVDEVAALVDQTFELAARVGEVFTDGSQVQKRAILELVGSNYTMEGKTLRFSWRKPFSMVAERPEGSGLRGIVDDVRTWIMESGEYFAFPECVVELLQKHRTARGKKREVV